MRCSHCGRSIEDDSKFCRYCGKKVETASKPAKSGLKLGAGRRALQGQALIWVVAYAAWVLANGVLWIVACFADAHENASRYFFPLGWSDYSSYDGFEFVVYTVVIPIVVCIIAYKWDWIKAQAKKDMDRLKQRRQQ